MSVYFYCSPTSFDAQVIYGGLLFSLLIAFLSFADGARVFMLCPRWCSPNVLFYLVKYSNLVFFLTEFSLVVAFFNPEVFCARLFVVLCLGAFALHHNAVVGTHFEMLAVWSVFTLLLPPGATRVSFIRILCAYSVSAPGISKLFIGGPSWALPDNIKLMSKEFAPSPMMLRIVLGTPDIVHLFLGSLGMIFEAFAPLAFIFVVNESYSIIVFVLFFAFHTATLGLVGMFFVHHIPVYVAALFSESPTLFEWPSFLLIILLVSILLLKVEEWPFSTMALFVYNEKQSLSFQKRFGSRRRLIGSISTNPPEIEKQKLLNQKFIGLTIKEAHVLDLVAWSLHASVPLISSQYEGDGRFGCPTYWAAPWLNLDNLDLVNKSEEAVEMAHSIFGIPRLIYDTATGDLVVSFYVIELDKELKTIESVITSR